MTGMDDGKVILKKVITADEEEPDTAVSEKASPAASKKVIIADTELQEETAVPVLSDDIKMLVTSMIHKEGKAFARVSWLLQAPSSHPYYMLHQYFPIINYILQKQPFFLLH